MDKSATIAEVLRHPAHVMLLSRPRRFGKTLLLTALQAFIEGGADDQEALFGDLAIWNDPVARQHLASYPVISLTFKDVASRTWDECIQATANESARAFRAHGDVRAALTGHDAATFDSFTSGEPNEVWLAASLEFLCEVLRQHHGERVVLLIDDHDAPIRAGCVHGYQERAVEFFRNFLSNGLKDNPHLSKGVLTGVLSVPKENLFSGLNVCVYSLLHPAFDGAFGFTEPEVTDLLARAGLAERYDDVQRWYGGHVFGRKVLYNPWSVLSFLADTPPGVAPRPYWLTVSSDELLENLIVRHTRHMQPELEALLAGEQIVKLIDEHVEYRELAHRPSAAWSFLVLSGYLRAEAYAPVSASQRASLGPLHPQHRDPPVLREHRPHLE